MSEEIELKDNICGLKGMQRKYKTNWAQNKCKFFIRFIIIFIGVFGLIYQTSQLVSQYMKRQTVVNIKLEENIKYNKIPSITICFPQMISMESMAQKYKDLKLIY